MSDVLQVLVGCDRCGEGSVGRKYARIDGVRLCRDCWEHAGRPWPKPESSEVDVANSVAAMQRRMLARGGTDRHLARSGKA